MKALILVLLLSIPSAIARVLDFSGFDLRASRIHERDLLGRPSILILTFSESTLDSSLGWMNALEDNLGRGVRFRNLIVIKGVGSDSMKKKIPKRFWEKTWILSRENIRVKFRLPQKINESYVIVVDAEGEVMMSVRGIVSQSKIEKIINTLNTVTPLPP